MADRRLAFDVPVRQPQRQAHTIRDEIQELNQTTAMMEQGRAYEPCSVPQTLSPGLSLCRRRVHVIDADFSRLHVVYMFQGEWRPGTVVVSQKSQPCFNDSVSGLMPCSLSKSVGSAQETALGRA